MNIIVLGGGAMGGLYGSYLSQHNDVTIIDVNEQLVERINQEGITLQEPDGTSKVYHPKAARSAQGMEPCDLLILFVKSIFSESALTANKNLIGSDTFLLTLQNGSGHDELLAKFADDEHIIIGTTQHNASAPAIGICKHGGSGMTYLGSVTGEAERFIYIAETFTKSGLDAAVSNDVTKMIWSKMFTNVSASVLTGILQVPLGFIEQDEPTWSICCQLIREAVAVANGMGMDFDCEEKIEDVRKVCVNSPSGLTSIYADLRDKRKTEVDAISGSVVRAGQRIGLPVPSHEMAVNLIHAMEHKNL